PDHPRQEHRLFAGGHQALPRSVRGSGRRPQQLDYVIARTDAAIAELEQKRAEIEKTLAELRVINATCRGIWKRVAQRQQRLEDGVN
ncbi:MAG: hypothetical protein IPL15_05440, partial [Comamonadaceae bacterium]|nr:hypothetical protein [Comamonadaceae bacterium]